MPKKIVLTGGPGAGKTTAADMFQRELGAKVSIVPEAATIVYSAGFSRTKDPEARRATQRAIYHIQRNLEDIQAVQQTEKILLCDRGTVDGAIYWPGTHEDFFCHLQTSLENELSRYDAVVFFETAAMGGIAIDNNNPTRNENAEEAIRIDAELRKLWSRHKQFIFVPHQTSFLKKIEVGLASLNQVVQKLTQGK